MYRVVIATPGVSAYSETFIRAHITRLPATVHVLHGGVPPTLYDDGQPIAPVSMRGRAVSYVRRRLAGESWESANDRRIGHVLRKLGVTGVLAEYGPTAVAMLPACAEAGIPLIAHFHGFDAYDRAVLEGPGRRYPELFRQASAVVAVSRAMRAQLIALGAPTDRVKYNPCGVDLTLFEESPAVQAMPLFLAVGRFVDKKAPDLTVYAFRQVLNAVPNARLLMIGDGPLLGACQRLAWVEGLGDSVEFLGVRGHAEVAQRMQAARAFVQHSITAASGDSEGTPVAVLEAQASGLPVVSTRHAGIPDVVIDGETGLLVDEGDVDGMADAMIRLAKEPELAARLGAAGRARVEAEFSMDKSIANLWKIIQNAIEEYHR